MRQYKSLNMRSLCNVTAGSEEHDSEVLTIRFSEQAAPHCSSSRVLRTHSEQVASVRPKTGKMVLVLTLARYNCCG
jgi:hypothetical protein